MLFTRDKELKESGKELQVVLTKLQLKVTPYMLSEEVTMFIRRSRTRILGIKFQDN